MGYHEHNLTYEVSEKNQMQKNFTFEVGDDSQIGKDLKAVVLKNKTTYLHMLLHTPAVFSEDFDASKDPDTLERMFFKQSLPLIGYMAQVKEDETVNLMEQLNSDLPVPKKEVDPTEDQFYPHWKPEIFCNLVFDSSIYHLKQGIPPAVLSAIKKGGLDWDTKTYAPIVQVSDFWVLKKHMVPLNESLIGQQLNLTLNF